jgi:2-polyprenyl-6-methoxyphenol hydroxylase-like FAD-dependent oxidoreductase
MTTPGRAVVCGGSLGGLLAANVLLRQGWDVNVYERAAGPLAGRGTGIVTHPQLVDVLHDAGVHLADGLGVAVPSRVAFDRSGAVIGELPLPQVLTSWSYLYGHLKDAFPQMRYHAGASLESFSQNDDEVAVRFADGREERADLVIGADGIRSSIRRQLLPDIVPQYAGYVAWRGVVDESALSPQTHAALFERFAFCLPPREQMLGYPIPGDGDCIEVGRRRFNFVWYRPLDEVQLRRAMTDPGGRYYPDGIPPALVDPRVVTAVRGAAEELLSPQFAEIVRATRQLFFQPIYDLASPRLTFGRVVLLGDAAFVARPHCGMGVTKAAGDAAALGQALDDQPTLPSALETYDHRRRAFGDRVIEQARHLGAYMQAQIRTDEERLMAESHRSTEAVLRETAVATDVLFATAGKNA